MVTVEGEAFLEDGSVESLRRFWGAHPVALTVLAALLVRLVVVGFVFRDQTAPVDHHAQFGWEMGWVARSIALGHGFSSPFAPATGPTALVPPLFPYLLAGVFRVFGLYTAGAAFAILAINSVFSSLTCVPVYLSARYAAGERVARAAAWGWAVYPYAIYFSAARVWDYALTALLFAMCFYVGQRLHHRGGVAAWVGFGALYGVAMLANPSILPLFVIFLGLAAFRRREAAGRWRRQGGVAMPAAAMLGGGAMLAAVVMLAPWTIRTYRAMGVVRPVRDNFWMECWAGNNGDLFESNAKWAHPASSAVEMRRFEALGETAYLSEKQALAVEFIGRHPGFFVRASVRRAGAFWTGFWSFDPAYLEQEPLQNADIFFCSTMTLLMLAGAFGLWRENRRRALPYVILIALFPLTYYVTHASPDYREPIEPEIVVLAAVGVESLRRRRMGLGVQEESRVAVTTSA